MVLNLTARATGRRRAARRRSVHSGGSALDGLKGALFSTAAAYVALSALALSAPDPAASTLELCRAALSFFALTSLGVLVFRRAGLLAIGLSLATLVLGLEAARTLPILHQGPQPQDALARLAGILAAVGLAALVRGLRSQPKGVSPISLAYLP